MRAQISTQIIPKIVLVTDEDGLMTVTNDAESVVEFVLGQICKWNPDVRILYKDSEGQWDELQHDGIKFIGFRLWRARSWQDIVTNPEFIKG